MSVPNQCLTDGGRNRAMGLSSWGSTVPPYGAAIAIRTISTKSNPPPARVGLRCTKRKSPRWRRAVLRGNVLDGAVSIVYGPYLPPRQTGGGAAHSKWPRQFGGENEPYAVPVRMRALARTRTSTLSY